MGKVIDSTYTVDSRYLLSQTPPNIVKDNYFLYELQDKINADWDYRPNRAVIEQETGIGTEEFFSIEVVVQTVRNDSGEKVSEDWRRLVFRDIKYPTRIGNRYRFAMDLNPETPVEKQSIWLATNEGNVITTASQVVQRCNGTLGSIYVNEKGEKTYHYEPVVQTTKLQSVSTSFSEVAVDPRGQLTIIAQHNQYTKDYYINQRFVIGYDRVYKIKNIIKTGSLATYDPYDVGVIEIYLDMDQIGEKDDFVNRIAYNGRDDETLIPAPIPPVADYQLKIDTTASYPYVLGGDPLNFKVGLYNGETVVENAIYIDISSTISTYKNYYEISGVEEVGGVLMISDNSTGFTLTRNKTSNRIVLNIRCFIPAEASPAGEELSQTIEVKIGNV